MAGLIVGCGEKGPTRYRASGSVTYKGNQRRPNVEFLLLDGCGHGLEKRIDDVYEQTLSFFERCC